MRPGDGQSKREASHLAGPGIDGNQLKLEREVREIPKQLLFGFRIFCVFSGNLCALWFWVCQVGISDFGFNLKASQAV